MKIRQHTKQQGAKSLRTFSLAKMIACRDADYEGFMKEVYVWRHRLNKAMRFGAL